MKKGMIVGLIVAEGEPKRLRSDKGFYELKGKTLLETACEK
jgi:molybdopterin-guanine dinucleotide biosynthesis protein A